MPMRITHSKNASSSKSYFELSDYLEQDPNPLLKGQWFGKGAATLGLTGEVVKEHFDRLVDNKMPFDDQKLTARNRADRRVGTDLTFSAPKSVSLLWGVTQDDDLLRAVQQAALETLADLEQDVQTRVNHARGKMTLEKTRNIVGASWVHTTSRPVDGWPDPNLHVHCFCINATKAGDRWTAADLSAIVKDSGYYEAVFQSRLAQKVISLGYPIVRNDREFEIAGISRSTIEKFSRRTALIERVAAERGITGADQKGRLGAQTRDKKSANSVPADQLPNKWRSELSPSEIADFARLEQRSIEPSQEQLTASQAVDFATDHSFEREAVVRERQVFRQAILRGMGTATVDQIRTEVAKREWIRQGDEEKAVLSTPEILAKERSLVAFGRNGRGRLSPLANDHQIVDQRLSDEQRGAVLGLLQSSDRVQLLRGVAGSGKTTMMRETIGAIKRSGHAVTVLAPTAEAAHGVLRDQEGFAAETLAKFLVDREAQQSVKEGVIWIDEAALVGTQDLATVAEIAKQTNSRLILSGDAGQHRPVAYGLPFQLLQTQAGLVPHEIRKIRRQQGQYKVAVELLSRGAVSEGLDRLDELGFIKEVQDDQLRNRTIASDYADSLEANQTSLVVAPSHAEREAITGAIRQELKSRGKIDDREEVITALRSKRLTVAQRQDTHNYAQGDVVEFVTKGKGGFKAGDRLRVAKVGENRILADSGRGLVEVPIGSPKSFDVYQEHPIEVARGDVLRITKNRRPDRRSSAKRLNNGTLLTVEGFTRDGDLNLSNGQTIPKDWGHVDHGVTVTSYASQGKTFDRVFVAQSSLSFPASSPEQAYVSASRGRKSVTVYTDNLPALRSAISTTRPAINASDLASRAIDAVATKPNRMIRRIEEIRLRTQHFAATQFARFNQWLLAQSRHPQQAR